MESLKELDLKAPLGAQFYSDITKGYYFYGDMTEKWYIHNSKLGWVSSAHRDGPPPALIRVHPVGAATNPCAEIPGPEMSPLRGLKPDTVIIDEAADEVNQPSHYKRKSSDVLRAVRSALLEDGDIEDLECIEAMLSHLSTVDQIRGALRANSFKYRWRYEDKDRLKSLRKARWYEDKLEQLEEVVESINE